MFGGRSGRVAILPMNRLYLWHKGGQWSVPHILVMRRLQGFDVRALACHRGRVQGGGRYDRVEKRGIEMIEVTKLNGVKVLVNPHLFEVVEETPDTVITLTTGKKIIVKESRQEIKNLVILYRKGIFAE